jgi:type IV pilus assembly protein PilA
MIDRLRQRSSDEGGFTLIELLVVILIIGILAAIAIPTFLNQKSKAYDASAKELVRTAQTTAETYATDHEGNYKGLSVGELEKYETGLKKCPASGPPSSEACIKEAKPLGTNNEGYEVTSKAVNTGDEFTIVKTTSGTFEHKCVSSEGSKKGCSGGESSSW